MPDNITDLNRLSTALNYVKTNGSVPTLTYPRTIDGVSFDGKANISHYGVCTTSADLSAKLVDCAGFTLNTGARIAVKFNNGNTAKNITLNVNSTGAIAVYFPDPYNITTLINDTTKETGNTFKQNLMYEFIYNGTRFELIQNSVFNFDGNATASDTANKLTTARNIGLSGAATGTPTAFDGSSDITIPVTVLAADKLTGTASVNTTGTATTAKSIIKTSNEGSTDSPVNLDNYLTPGKYYMAASGYTNSPFGDSDSSLGGAINTGALLYVIDGGSNNGTNEISTFGHQIFIARINAHRTATVAIRTYNKEATSNMEAGFSSWRILMGNVEVAYSKTTSTSINLDSFYTPGIYHFANSTTINVSNLPGSAVNGWLIVMTNSGRSALRQLFFRQGSPTSWSGNAAYSRSAFFMDGSTVWTDWVPIYIGNGTLRWGTADPSSGDVDGSIYLKYT